MEDVLALYEKPLSERAPVVCVEFPRVATNCGSYPLKVNHCVTARTCVAVRAPFGSAVWANEGDRAGRQYSWNRVNRNINRSSWGLRCLVQVYALGFLPSAVLIADVVGESRADRRFGVGAEHVATHRAMLHFVHPNEMRGEGGVHHAPSVPRSGRTGPFRFTGHHASLILEIWRQLSLQDFPSNPRVLPFAEGGLALVSEWIHSEPRYLPLFLNARSCASAHRRACSSCNLDAYHPTYFSSMPNLVPKSIEKHPTPSWGIRKSTSN